MVDALAWFGGFVVAVVLTAIVVAGYRINRNQPGDDGPGFDDRGDSW